jgi:hypothetical protein
MLTHRGSRVHFQQVGTDQYESSYHPLVDGLLCATGVKSSHGFDAIEAFIILASMWSSKWVAAVWVIDGSNSDG